MRLTAGFRAAAGDPLVAALEAERNTVYGVGPAGELAYTNPAWREFALANDGQAVLERFAIGASVCAALPEVLAAFYEDHLRRLAPGEVWEHAYECSSPTQLRRFRMRTARLADRHHLVVSHHLVEELPAGPGEGDVASFLAPNGVITQCAHCRRVREPATRRWAWVPALLAWRRAVSHGLCPPCLEYHYPEAV
jgi:hypothetical protein